MPLPSLPAEVWVQILPLLQEDTPAALSRPLRSENHQANLAAALKTCKLFQAICEPLLYQTINSDDVPMLLRDIANPSFHERFAHTRTLHLDYSKKGQRAKYPQLLASGGELWETIHPLTSVAEAIVLKACAKEAQALLASLKAINAAGMARVFPKVEVITVGMVFGSEQDGWKRYGDSGPTASSIINKCRMEFGTFLRSGNLKHLCIRDPAGPLSLPSLTYASARPNSKPLGYTTNIHFDRHVDHLPVPLGDKITSTFDDAIYDDWAHIITSIGTAYEKFGDLREQASPSDRRRRDAVDVSIFCSTAKWGLDQFDASRALAGTCSRLLRTS